VTVEGVKDVADDMVARYFSKFGLLIEWTRDESSSSGILEFAEAYMVDYCLRRQTHQIDGNEVIVSKALPKFDEEDSMKPEEGDEDEVGGVKAGGDEVEDSRVKDDGEEEEDSGVKDGGVKDGDEDGENANLIENENNADEVENETSQEVENEAPTEENSGNDIE